jgi:ubiquinone/menaquinone biosynthesis C-methylase UbiE/uncharacterized protein YbaR (Trm112 family)
MQKYLIEFLECPSCHGTLQWKISEWLSDQVEEAEIICNSCSASYHVHKGIGVFLSADKDRKDLWEQTDSELIKYLKSNPDIEYELMNTPINILAPTDQFFRALVLEENGLYIEAKEIERLANSGLYSNQYQYCWQKQIEYILAQLSDNKAPVLDIASGRGYLIERMASQLNCPVIASDFSVKVLQRNLQYLKSAGLYNQVSLLAFDARKTPFKNGIIGNMTTNLGLPNIEHPGSLLKELNRIVSENFLAITHFYPEDDGINAKIIREAGLDELLYRETALRQFSDAGWNVVIRNRCEGIAKPTPEGKILKGARIDGLPVTETILEWCVVEGR